MCLHMHNRKEEKCLTKHINTDIHKMGRREIINDFLPACYLYKLLDRIKQQLQVSIVLSVFICVDEITLNLKNFLIYSFYVSKYSLYQSLGISFYHLSSSEGLYS